MKTVSPKVSAAAMVAAFSMLTGFGSQNSNAAVATQADVRVHSTGTPPEFISGTGVTIDNFVQNTNNGVTVSLKPRNRDPIYGGEPTSVSGNQYTVLPGTSVVPINAGKPQFVIDYQFDPGADALTNYILELDVDFDPSTGPPMFNTTSKSITGVSSWSLTDGYFTPVTRKGPWNDTTVPYVISNTTNLSFLTPPPGAPAYNPNTPGEYEIRLTAFAPNGVDVLSSVTAFATVAPEPASLGLIGVTAGTLLLRRRRRTA